MRLYLSLLIPSLLAFSSLCLQGCAWEKKEDDLGRGPVKVQIPLSVDGNYKLDVVELFTLKNVTSLKGLAARFLMDPESRNGQLTGRPPEVRYIRDHDGIVVAKDATSLQLLTVYAHFEKLKELDEKVGAGGILSYPRTVAVNARLRKASGEIEGNNALYSGQFDALMVEAYTQEQLPLMANAGVIAHEHFHSLFQKLVINPLTSKGKYPGAERPTAHDENKKLKAMGLLAPSETSIDRKSRTWSDEGNDPQCPVDQRKDDPEVRKRYHATLMRGINEGLADVWGWIYSGDNIFVRRSLPQVKMDRDVDVVPERIYSKDRILKAVSCANYSDDYLITKYSYPHGTQLARTLKNFAVKYGARKNLSSAETQVQMGQFLIAALSGMEKDLESLKDDEYYTLSRALATFALQVKDLESPECNFLGKLMSGEDRKDTRFPETCKSFEESENGKDQEPPKEAPPEASPTESGDPLR